MGDSHKKMSLPQPDCEGEAASLDINRTLGSQQQAPFLKIHSGMNDSGARFTYFFN